MFIHHVHPASGEHLGLGVLLLGAMPREHFWVCELGLPWKRSQGEADLSLMRSGFKTQGSWDSFCWKGQEEEACGPCFSDVSEGRGAGSRGQTAEHTVDFGQGHRLPLRPHPPPPTCAVPSW